MDEKKYIPRAIKNKISGAKNELLNPEGFKVFARTPYDEDVVKIYKKYEEKLKRNSSVDFDDLLMLPIELFRKDKEALEHYQNRYKYVFIDEYQDTNEAQYLLSKMISDKYKNICVVGDESQSIYSWRGANYKNILNFEKDYKNAKVILLEQNYRSTKTILEAANSVIKNNKDRREVNLFSTFGDGVKIKYLRGNDEKDEVKLVIDEISKLLNNGYTYNDFAVLCRSEWPEWLSQIRPGRLANPMCRLSPG